MEVVVRPDRLEILSAGRWVVIRFKDIAHWPRPRWLRRLLFRVGWRPKWLPVADRDWFHPPSDRFFTFYTDPRIVVFMPIDEPAARSESAFLKVQEVIRAGGFHTFDLG
jgi:hypothetical protein